MRIPAPSTYAQRGMPGGDLVHRGTDRDQLEGRPAEQLDDVEHGRQVGRLGAEQAAQQHHRRGAGARAGMAATATPSEPRTVPMSSATTAAPRDMPGSAIGTSRKIAPVKPSRLTPRLPHRPSWSTSRSARGDSSTRVCGTSACSAGADLRLSTVISSSFAGITRSGSAVGGADAALSARWPELPRLVVGGAAAARTRPSPPSERKRGRGAGAGCGRPGGPAGRRRRRRPSPRPSAPGSAHG